MTYMPGQNIKELRSFLVEETPAIIQIIGLPSLFNIVVKNELLGAVLALITSLLLSQYLSQRLFEYIRAQIRDSQSELNHKRTNIDILRYQMIRYAKAIGIIAGILPHVLILLLRLK